MRNVQLDKWYRPGRHNEGRTILHEVLTNIANNPPTNQKSKPLPPVYHPDIESLFKYIGSSVENHYQIDIYKQRDNKAYVGILSFYGGLLLNDTYIATFDKFDKTSHVGMMIIQDPITQTTLDNKLMKYISDYINDENTNTLLKHPLEDINCHHEASPHITVSTNSSSIGHFQTPTPDIDWYEHIPVDSRKNVEWFIQALQHNKDISLSKNDLEDSTIKISNKEYALLSIDLSNNGDMPSYIITPATNEGVFKTVDRATYFIQQHIISIQQRELEYFSLGYYGNHQSRISLQKQHIIQEWLKKMEDIQ